MNRLLSGYVACMMISCMGPDQETLVDELRVMAIQTVPAEVQLRDFTPDESGVVDAPVINVVVADPLQSGYQVAIWPCTNFGEGCEERKVFEETPEEWVELIEGTESLVTVPVLNNPLWGALLSQSPTPDVPVSITSIFVLACAPEVCVEIQNAINGTWDLDKFANPLGWISKLPLEGSSMAIKQLPVSNGMTDDTRLKNPTLIPLFDLEEPLTVSGVDPTLLPFEITLFQQDAGVASIFGYTTLGGFDRNVFANNGLKMAELEPAERSINWYAGEAEPGVADLFVIVEDGLGGTGVWLGSGSVVEDSSTNESATE